MPRVHSRPEDGSIAFLFTDFLNELVGYDRAWPTTKQGDTIADDGCFRRTTPDRIEGNRFDVNSGPHDDINSEDHADLAVEIPTDAGGDFTIRPRSFGQSHDLSYDSISRLIAAVEGEDWR